MGLSGLEQRQTFAARQAARGYHVVYRVGEVNYCPACGRSHWWIGRVSVECGFCGTALDLPESSRGGGLFVTRFRR